MDKPENSVLAKYFKEETSKSEAELVQNWIHASEENAKVYEQMKKIWEMHGVTADAYQPDLTQAWNNIESEIETERAWMPWLYRVAAMLVLGIGIAYFIADDKPAAVSGLSTAPTELFATDAVRSIDLPDGTTISLNKGASIRYDASFGGSDRKIDLQGEAFFEVVRDEERPFIIQTESTTTQVLGTSFSINPTEAMIVVTVVSGKVSFSNEQSSVILTKGEQGNYHKSTQSISENLNKDPNFLSWKTGKLFFNDVSIDGVMADLERHYQVQFETDNKNISKLTASFDNQSLEEVLAIISTTLDVTIEAKTQTNYFIH